MVELSFLVKDGKDFHVPFLLEKWLFVSLAAFRGCWWLLIWVRTRPKSGVASARVRGYYPPPWIIMGGSFSNATLKLRQYPRIRKYQVLSRAAIRYRPLIWLVQE
jgi:hypothetical protein